MTSLPRPRRSRRPHRGRLSCRGRAGDAVFLVRLAWVLRRYKELDSSVAVLELSLTKDPSARSVRHQLAEALYEGGRHEEAEKHLRVLLRPAQKETSIMSPAQP